MALSLKRPMLIDIMESLQHSVNAKKRRLWARPDFLEVLDAEEFKMRFRLSKESFSILLEEISSKIANPTSRLCY